MNSNIPTSIPILAVTPEGFSDFLEKRSRPAGLARQAAETPAAFRIRQESWADLVQRMADEENGPVIDRASGICIQPVAGFMLAGAGPIDEAIDGCFDVNRISAVAGAVAADPSIKALVLRISSGGGAVAGLAENCQALISLAESRPEVPVMAYIDGTGCSAAARIAASCQETHAGIGARVGSISTIMVKYDTSRHFANEGVDAKVFTDGKFKSAGYLGVPITDEQSAHFEAQVAAVGAEFKAFMAARRPGLTDDDMQGQSFVASAGQYPDSLLDGIGWQSFDQFLSTLASILTHDSQ